ncbi:MAG: hypothetical protein LAT51_09365, partial [Flavobacteriaceae bacterium]|nr:hypothetical protein [Flavobacteriaceae bacterium]
MEQFKHLLSVNFSKASYVFTFVLVFFISNAQDSKLFDYSWELEEIVTDEETFTASPYPDPEAEQTFMDYIYFYGSIENQNGSFMFGIYHNAMGDLIIFNNENSSFKIELYSTHFGEASPAEMFFNQYFVYEDYMEQTFHNPFTYDFREEEDKIYLDITNGEGDVATFWTSTLSTPSFEETAFSFYPNPVKDRLHLESP